MTVKNRNLGFYTTYKDAKEKAETMRKYYKGYTLKIIRNVDGSYTANFSKYNFLEKLLKIVF